MVAAYANLAARIAVLRSDGVLKRIRTTPLRPAIYLTGQLASTLATTLLVAALTIALGQLVFGVSPRLHEAFPLMLALALGITCFAALALAVSPLIRSADAASPITNATYLPIALVSGVFDPSLHLPGWLNYVVAIFPIKALYGALQAAYDPAVHSFPSRDLLILAAWSAGGVAVAHRFFRWQP